MLFLPPMTSAEGLRRLLSRQDLTMEELVEQADALVKELAPKQTRYKVTERPDARASSQKRRRRSRPVSHLPAPNKGIAAISAPGAQRV